ncbi:MAG: IS21 family transposase, partial [Acidimicrobiia bacterium]
AAVARAVTFGRYRASDVRSILAAGAGIAQPARPGEALVIALPTVATRPLSDYAIGQDQ